MLMNWDLIFIFSPAWIHFSKHLFLLPFVSSLGRNSTWETATRDKRCYEMVWATRWKWGASQTGRLHERGHVSIINTFLHYALWLNEVIKITAQSCTAVSTEVHLPQMHIWFKVTQTFFFSFYLCLFLSGVLFLSQKSGIFFFFLRSKYCSNYIMENPRHKEKYKE